MTDEGAHAVGDGDGQPAEGNLPEPGSQHRVAGEPGLRPLLELLAGFGTDAIVSAAGA